MTEFRIKLRNIDRCNIKVILDIFSKISHYFVFITQERINVIQPQIRK